MSGLSRVLRKIFSGPVKGGVYKFIKVYGASAKEANKYLPGWSLQQSPYHVLHGRSNSELQYATKL